MSKKLKIGDVMSWIAIILGLAVIILIFYKLVAG